MSESNTLNSGFANRRIPTLLTKRYTGPLRIERRFSGLESEVLTVIRWTYFIQAEDVGIEPTLPIKVGYSLAN